MTASPAARPAGSINDRPILDREIAGSAWIRFDGQYSFVRRSLIGDTGWSVLLAIPITRIHASRVLGIIITLLAATMAQIYLFGREHGIRDRIQVRRRREVQEMAQALRFQATTDPLTGTYNRAKFDEALASEIARAKRYRRPFTLILFDIDHFKRVNDSYGHQAGDDVLVRLSAIAKETIRATDLLARWGGEEFVILATGQEGETGCLLAEKLRATVEATSFEYVGKVTCSLGVAQFVDSDSAESLIARADGALYRAKANGRNRAEFSPASSSSVAEIISAA
jgi:diguanylate cyclase (GGDEF)-like protein